MAAALAQLVADHHAAAGAGLAVGVFRRGTPVFLDARGDAVLAPRTAATPHTCFRLASLSKQFTAAAALLLCERGRLRLDDAVAAHLPELARLCPTARVRHLLTHTSGVPDYEALIPDGRTAQLRDAEIPALLRAARCDFTPGTRFRYSNSGYALLAVLVERIEGRRFADVLRAELFAPLGMRHAAAPGPGADARADRALGYTPAGVEMELTDASVTSAVLGDGGVYASLDDLARWEEALENGRLLPRPVLERSWRRAALDDGTEVPYGFGWFVDTDGGRPRLTHHGESVGFTSAVVRYPDAALGVWVLSNRTGGEPWTLAQRLADRVLAEAGEADADTAPAERWPFLTGGAATRGPEP